LGGDAGVGGNCRHAAVSVIDIMRDSAARYLELTAGVNQSRAPADRPIWVIVSTTAALPP
jgi:hypothetical protein